MTDVTQTSTEYENLKPLYQKMIDSYNGARDIKAQTDKYLKPTPAMRQEGFGTENSIGQMEYEDYVFNAEYPDVLAQNIIQSQGVMHQKPAVIKVPEQLQHLITHTTPEGHDIQAFYRSITKDILIFGRSGIMVDFSETPDPLTGINNPYFVRYNALDIRNWSDDFIILRETAIKYDGFKGEESNRYRVLILIDGVYHQGVFEKDFIESQLIIPTALGNTFDEFPFVFVNVTDIASKPQNPPLLGLADIAITVYQLDADYKVNLKNQSSDIVVLHSDNTAGEKIVLSPRRVLQTGQGGSAEILHHSSGGIAGQRQAIIDSLQRASEIGSRLLPSSRSDSESGSALAIRNNSQTTSLRTIVLTSALALEELLKKTARWMDLPEELIDGDGTEANPGIVVEPNTDFTNEQLIPQSILTMIQAKIAGAPITDGMINEEMRRVGYTRLSLDEVYQQVVEEDRRKAELRETVNTLVEETIVEVDEETTDNLS